MTPDRTRSLDIPLAQSWKEVADRLPNLESITPPPHAKLSTISADGVLKNGFTKPTEPKENRIVLEFTGSPRSGKNSLMQTVEKKLNQLGVSNSIHSEMRDDDLSAVPWLFNLGISINAIEHLVRLRQQKPFNPTITFIERGVFNCLPFAVAHQQRQRSISPKESSQKYLFPHDDTRLEEGLVLRSGHLINLLVIFNQQPDVSIARGSTTNPELLAHLEQGYERLVSRICIARIDSKYQNTPQNLLVAEINSEYEMDKYPPLILGIIKKALSA